MDPGSVSSRLPPPIYGPVKRHERALAANSE